MLQIEECISMLSIKERDSLYLLVTLLNDHPESLGRTFNNCNDSCLDTLREFFERLCNDSR